MNDIRSEELSALIDGELDATRATQVRAAIAADPALRADYEALARLDMGLRGAADASRFAPDIDLPRASTAARTVRDWAILPVVTLGLLLVRLMPKFIDLAALGWLLQIAVASAILFMVVRMASERDENAIAAS